MPDAHLRILSQIAEGVVASPKGVRWFGQPAVRLPAAVARRPEEERAEYLAVALREMLYAHVYTVGRVMLSEELKALRSTASAQNLASALHLANPGTGRLESGWRYLRPGRAPGTLVVEKNGLTLTVAAGALRAGLDPASLREGEEAPLKTPAGRMNLSPGFYVAHSDAEPGEAGPLARFYLNVAPAGAPHLLHRLCGALNAAGLAFDLKVASDLSLYHRADVGVLYVPREQARAALRILQQAAPGDAWLRPWTPAFTCRIAPGLAAADDPGGGESFGLHRCRIIAAALLRHPRARAAERLAAIRAAFEAEGLSVERPHLGPGRQDIYAGLA